MLQLTNARMLHAHAAVHCPLLLSLAAGLQFARSLRRAPQDWQERLTWSSAVLSGRAY
jgi:hypothetical protein